MSTAPFCKTSATVQRRGYYARALLTSALAAIAFLNGCGSAGGSQAHSNEQRTVIVPTVRGPYFKEDIRFRLTLPARFLAQHGAEWEPPIGQVSFPIDLRDDTATPLTPTNDPTVVVVTLSVVLRNAIDTSLDKRNPRYSGGNDWIWYGAPHRRFGLHYATNVQYPGAAPEETLFGEGPPFHTEIHCQPSGNIYPSLCTLRTIGEPGGGINPRANAAILTEVVFRREQLPQWQSILDHVNRFLKGRVVVMNWPRS